MIVSSNPPSVTFPSPNEWPDTLKNITGITKAREAILTVVDHGFTAADQGITTVDILQVRGMTQINHQPGRIQLIIDPDNFSVNIDSTNYYSYTGGGVISIVTGTPPTEQASFQVFNTPFQNIA